MNKNNKESIHNDNQFPKINIFINGFLSFVSIILSTVSFLIVILLPSNIRIFELWQIQLFLGISIAYILFFSLITSRNKQMPKSMKLGQYFKRLFDVIYTTYTFIFVLPFIIIISLLIKFDSRGPIIIRQRRIGQNGKEIYLIKFRTKSVSENNKLTFMGKLLKRFDLDYLPRLYNVLEGEISLVGPYARSPEEINKIRKIIKQKLLLVKPGITGLWQISDEEPNNAIVYDLKYVDDWSLLLDLKIFLKTPLKILFKH